MLDAMQSILDARCQTLAKVEARYQTLETAGGSAETYGSVELGGADYIGAQTSDDFGVQRAGARSPALCQAGPQLPKNVSRHAELRATVSSSDCDAHNNASEYREGRPVW